MLEGILLDNDVILKVCAYRCHYAAVTITTIGRQRPCMLAISRFTLRSQVKRSRSLADRAATASALDEALSMIDRVDPTDSEIALAAEFEERATALSLEFDTGESQLLAVMLLRGAQLLVTGDKRAIRALHRMVEATVEGKIVCLEQLIASVVNDYDVAALRASVCAEPSVDKAITACFVCSACVVEAGEVLAGLRSYCAHLRKDTGAVLLCGDDLSTEMS